MAVFCQVSNRIAIQYPPLLFQGPPHPKTPIAALLDLPPCSILLAWPPTLGAKPLVCPQSIATAELPRLVLILCLS
jgi:hypothetical protein